MKRWLWCLCAVAVLAATPAFAQDEGAEKPKRQRPRREKPARDKGALRGEYAMMARECKLTEEQVALLKEKLAARAAEEAAWRKDNAAKLEEAQKAMKAAREAKDREAVKRAAEEHKTVLAERNKIVAKHMEAIMGILTPEQKEAWTGFTTYRTMMRSFSRLDLSEDQKAQVREMCTAAAKDVMSVDASDRKARGQAMNKLRKEIADKVLTEEQRGKMTQKPRRQPRRARQPKPEGGDEE